MGKRKIILLLIAVIVSAFVLNYFLTIIIVKNNFEKKIEKFLATYSIQALSIIDLNRKETLNKVMYDIKVAHSQFYTKYNLVETAKKVEFRALNQITHKEKLIYVNQWLLNGNQLQYHYEFVDDLKRMVGGTVTIFQKIDDGFLRISTNVRNEDYSRAVGTYIPKSSPVIKTVMSGETYIGRAYVVNDWYQTAYEPIYIDGEIRGMLYVGVKEKDLQNLRNTLKSIKIGETGYLFVHDEKGSALIHPHYEDEDMSDFEVVKLIKQKKNGIIKYNFHGVDKIASVRYYKPFGWYVAITINRDELFREALLSVQLFTIIISFVLSAVIIILIARIFGVHERDLKQKGELLSKKNEELENANNTKNKFFSIIAHDLKNPLGSFKEATRLLHKNFDIMDEEEKVTFLTEINKSADNIYELLENLLEWSRSQRGHVQFNPVKADISFICQNTIELFERNAAKKNIELTMEASPGINAYFDVEMITTIIRNLVANAIKFTPREGRVLIMIHKQDTEVEVMVIDNGVGISEEDQKKLFRLDIKHSTIGTDNEKGTGLGLILCNEFIEKHESSITLKSRLGKGSVFSFLLPAAG